MLTDSDTKSAKERRRRLKERKRYGNVCKRDMSRATDDERKKAIYCTNVTGWN